MTTVALFDAVPLVISDSGMGNGLRHPLGIAIIGGLVVGVRL
ncbi:MAG: efflux RND transporter permease subunit [Geminicoccaceae bacterium]